MTTFADLIYIYRKSDRKSEWMHSDRAVFCVNTADELRLLIALDEECEKTGLPSSVTTSKLVTPYTYK